MNGWTKIKEAYARGLKPHQVYQPFDALYRAIRRFIDADYFGLLRWDGSKESYVPKHCNGDGNPFPTKDRYGRPARRQFKKSDLLCHLFAERSDIYPRFAFMVNSPRSNKHLLSIDIDGDDSTITGGIAAHVYETIFPDHHLFVEPSRNRHGHYIWMVVRRTSTPQGFNDLMNAFGGMLRERFRVDERNKVDGVKATLHYDHGDDFDRWLKRLGPNPNDRHRGLLATMPLSGSLNDGTRGERMRECFLEFVKRDKKGEYVNAIDESFFQAIVSARKHDLEISLANKTSAVPPLLSSCTKLSTSESTTEMRKKSLLALLERTRSEANPMKRMRLASSLYYHEHRQYADDAFSLVRYYEKAGFNTGKDLDGRRVQRATVALERHRATERQDKPKRFKAADYLPMLKYVTDDIKTHPAIKYRYRVDDLLVAIALYTYTINAFANKTPERMHTCPDNALKGMYEKMAAEGVIPRPVRDKEKRVAIRQMLQLAGLIVLRDGNHIHGGKLRGVSDKFGLGPNHDRFQEFVSRFGHVVDPGNLTLTSTPNAA